MNLIIPFEGQTKFDYSVKEICSISLEHEYTLNTNSLLGNFIITGTCKEHELSVNTTDFKFTLPFSVDLPESVIPGTITLAIDNFVYNLDNNNLNINIDYLIKGDEKEEERKEIIIPDIIKKPILDNNKQEITIHEEEKDTSKIEKNTNNIIFEDDYITYQIHIIKETDTIESITKMYNCDEDTIYKLNNITTLVPNNKLIIPLDND